MNERRGGSGSPCPNPEFLVRCATAEGSRGERRATLRHVSECADCGRLLKDLLDISAEIDRLTAETGAPARPPRGFEAAKGRRSVWTRSLPRPAIAALVTLFGLAVITFSIIKLAERPAARGGPQGGPQLVSPAASAVVLPGEVLFEWKSLPGARSYTVELFDKTLELLWRSEPMKENRAGLPKAAGLRIARGEPFFWRVTAVLENDVEVSSGLAEFSLEK